MRENPTCPSCGVTYNRAAVIRELRKITPETFMFAVWTTRFKCVKCKTEIVITGVEGE